MSHMTKKKQRQREINNKSRVYFNMRLGTKDMGKPYRELKALSRSKIEY